MKEEVKVGKTLMMFPFEKIVFALFMDVQCAERPTKNKRVQTSKVSFKHRHRSGSRHPTSAAGDAVDATGASHKRRRRSRSRSGSGSRRKERSDDAPVKYRTNETESTVTAALN